MNYLISLKKDIRIGTGIKRGYQTGSVSSAFSDQ